MGDAKNDLWFVVGLLVLLGFVWFLTGGPERSENGGFFLAPQFGSNSSDNTNDGDNDQVRRATDIEEEFARIKQELERVKSILADSVVAGEKSPFIGRVSIRTSSNGPGKALPAEEFVELEMARRDSGSVNITGWTLESLVTGKRAVIGQGARLPKAGLVNVERDILLSADDRVFVLTGRSPIGVSFRTNACSGYLEQFQDFEPSLTRACPRPEDDLESFAPEDAKFDSACVAFVNRTSACTTPLSNIPIEIGNSCRSFIATDLTYNGCVENHKDDAGFFGNEWRVFLGRSSELWKSDREVIRLLDSENRTVDVFTF